MGPIGSSNVVKCFIEADGFKVDLKCIWSVFLEYRLWSDLELARLEQWEKRCKKSKWHRTHTALGTTGNISPSVACSLFSARPLTGRPTLWLGRLYRSKRPPALPVLGTPLPASLTSAKAVYRTSALSNARRPAPHGLKWVQLDLQMLSSALLKLMDLKLTWNALGAFLEYRHLEWFGASKAGAMEKNEIRASNTKRIRHWDLPEMQTFWSRPTPSQLSRHVLSPPFLRFDWAPGAHSRQEINGQSPVTFGPLGLMLEADVSVARLLCPSACPGPFKPH